MVVNYMKIYIFGNPLLKEDSAPLKIIHNLQHTFPDVKFIVTDPNENFPPEGEKDLVILDTVKGIKKAKMFALVDLQKIQKSPNSPHDYDLGMHLLLLKKLKKINSVKIIGVPQDLDSGLFIKWLKTRLPLFCLPTVKTRQ